MLELPLENAIDSARKQPPEAYVPNLKKIEWMIFLQ